MAVGFYNFAKLHDSEFQTEILERFKEIVTGNAFVEGKWNTAFETEFAQMQKAKHCLLVANGTDSLEICLQALDMQPGDKVAMPGISFYATAEVVINRGGIPVFVDVNPTTGLMDLDSFKRVIKQHKIKFVMPVHIYGLPVDIEGLEVICKENKIQIIEDAAQGQGGYLKNAPIGGSGHLTSFSFYPTKNLGAFGDAGAILTNDDDLATMIKSIRNHGRSPNGHTVVGRNSRCDHLQAAVLHLKLKKTPEQNKMRKDIAKKYLEILGNLPIRLVPQEYVNTSSWHLFPIGLRSKDEKYALKEHLGKLNIGSSLFYEKALPEEKTLLKCEGEKTHALDFAAKTLCIPMNPFLSENEIMEVSQAIKSFIK